MIKLYQQSSTGKIKFLELWTEGANFFTKWGLLGHKTQTTKKKCKAMNVGKANELTPAEQAIAEMKAKATIKMKEGYSKTKPKEASEKKKVKTSIPTDVKLSALPTGFCPNKPISEATKKVLESATVYAQRKFNGHCIFLVRDENGSAKVYSRRMEDLTDRVSQVSPIQAALSNVSNGTFVIGEFICQRKPDNVEITRHVATILRTEDPTEVLDKYNLLLKDHYFSLVVFDILFLDNTFVGNKDYKERHKMLDNLNFNIPAIFDDWKEQLHTAKKNGWEGFVLRETGKASHIGFTLDGKAKRAGSYKYKFTKTDDFFVTGWEKGKSGKHASVYAKFKLAQYDEKGKEIDRGYVGPGTLTHDELKTITEQIDNKTLKPNFVVEVEFQDFQESGKLFFGVIQRLRPDKDASECISER